MAVNAPDSPRMRFVWVTFLWQIVIIILYGTCTEYGPALDHTRHTPETDNIGKYPMFQDVHVMIFVGFGFLMTFLKKYGYSAVSFNFIISALTVQWAMLMSGFWEHAWNNKLDHLVQLDIVSLIKGDFAAAAVMISFGAVIGKVSPLQMFFIMICEIFFFAINESIGVFEFHAVDMGGSMFVHTFGAYFGLAVSWAMTRPAKSAANAARNSSDRTSDMFAMIGTLFLWMFWPSFNGALAPPIQQNRVVVNTVLALSASCVSAFFTDAFLRKKRGKFDMVSIQNATLAGGVAVGSASDLVIGPWGALTTGMAAGLLSVVGYTYIQPYLARTIGLDDTCGVHNLHGMPGVMGGIAGIISAASTGTAKYGESISAIFPARAAEDTPDGLGWDAQEQAFNQLYALLTTLAIAISGGLLVGAVVSSFGQFDEDLWYDDKHLWDHEDFNDDDDDEAAAEQGRMLETRVKCTTVTGV